MIAKTIAYVHNPAFCRLLLRTIQVSIDSAFKFKHSFPRKIDFFATVIRLKTLEYTSSNQNFITADIMRAVY